MALNKQKGNMYPFVTHTWNVIKGECPHGCGYCYMKRWKNLPELYFNEGELNVDLGKDNFIFVGSSCDMWAKEIPDEWINKVLNHCWKYENKYLFQSKNPFRFNEWQFSFPENRILATTIETNRANKILEKIKAPQPYQRSEAIRTIPEIPKIVTVEPIMDFDLIPMFALIKPISPQMVIIGADSGKNNLPEPSAEKIRKLIGGLQVSGLRVVVKNNLERLM